MNKPVSDERLKAILGAANAETPDHCAVVVIVVAWGSGEEYPKLPFSMASTGDDLSTRRILRQVGELS